MVDRVYQGGVAEDANSWLPVGVPGDGDRLDTNGLPITFNVSATYGVDDGSASITNPTQFPASEEAEPITLAPGVVLTLRGRIENSNGDLNLGDGAKITYTNSDAQVQDFGNFDNDTTAPTLTLGLNSILEFTGSGSMIGTMNGGGAVISDGGIIAGFGDGTSVFTANVQSDPAQCFCARPLYFVRSKGDLDIQCYGDGTMGDIEVRGLYNIDPVSGGGIKFDGNDDATLHATSNLRIADDIRCEGDPMIRYMQGYTTGLGMRCTGSPLCIDGNGDWQNLENWFVGNHGGSFMRALGALKNSWFRDTTDNPHAISLARLKEILVSFSGNVFDLPGIQGSSDTGDCFATDAASSATDFTVVGQELTLEENLVLPNEFTGSDDGPVFLTLNGHLTLQTANPPKIRVLNNTGRFSNGGHPINVDEFNSAGATPSDTIIEHKRNVWSNPDSQPPMSIGVLLQGIAGANDDVITLGESDENVFHGYPDGLGLLESLLGVNDLNTLSTAPIFADPTRNLARWARECHDITEEEAVVNLVRAGFPGYGSTPAVDAADFDVEKLRQWVRAGFHNKEPAHAGRGITTPAPTEMTDVNASTPIVDGISVNIQFNQDLTGVQKITAYNPTTDQLQEFVLDAKPATNEEQATAVQGDLPHGPVEIGVKL